MKDTLQASNTLAESYLGSFLSYFGLWMRALVLGSERESSMSVGLFVLILLSSMASTLNLFTRSDQGTLFSGHSIQNPSLLEGPLPQKWNPSKPANLILAPPAALSLVILCLSNRDSP